ncbi:interleukin-1 receptor accessory protein-like 1-A [Aethina tumida]|uniref:interleukin-1 receptor accessory protein-like 1-A n=1 Tax=Aethina tumida TaxID=116153 RepID=UPI0021489922|nr:interleukin-1 receptor accessory protein-like 1-A [Aethina tumida]
MARKLIGLLALAAVAGVAMGIENFCEMNTYSGTGPYMQLTKEANYEEYAMVGQFKALHCCAKGYRSIEWSKDGKPYPWPTSFSRLILYPESANQTVYTQSVTEDDAGNYTCVLRNDTVVIQHTIQFKVFEKVPDDPKVTYLSDNKEVILGQELRLFCEAFAGRVDLPDAHNDAVWHKTGDHNGTMDKDPRIHQIKSAREEEHVYGTYLIIDNVRKEDLGEYVCMITKPGKTIEKFVTVRETVQIVYLNPNPIPVKQLLLFSLGILLGITTAIILYVRYALKVRVHMKDLLAPIEDSTGKTSDVLIVYSDKDSEIALGVLLPTLENRYNYKCASRELPKDVNQWYTDLKTPAQNSKRLLAVISPAALKDNWENENVLMALKQLQSVGPQLCCVTLKELPLKENEVKNAQGETLTGLSRSLNVILWEQGENEKFWLSLRLRLPPNRRVETVITVPQGENNKRLSSNSQESLDNLV